MYPVTTFSIIYLFPPDVSSEYDLRRLKDKMKKNEEDRQEVRGFIFCPKPLLMLSAVAGEVQEASRHGKVHDPSKVSPESETTRTASALLYVNLRPLEQCMPCCESEATVTRTVPCCM